MGPQVKGLVAELIEVKDLNTATALEVTAGGKMYNVVVDTEVTAKKLLGHGKLQHRVTIIPLNQVERGTIEAAKVNKAKQLVGAENADLALSLVVHDKDVSAAMEYVFGRTIVCKTSEAAEAVAYNRTAKLFVKAVTLDGDVYSPSGTLTGGAKPKSEHILERLHELKRNREVCRRLCWGGALDEVLVLLRLMCFGEIATPRAQMRDGHH